MVEKQNQPFRLSFNASLKVDFQGSQDGWWNRWSVEKVQGKMGRATWEIEVVENQ